MDRLAAVCEDILRHLSPVKKVDILAEYFKTLNDKDLSLAVQFLTAGPVIRSSTNHTLFDIEQEAELKVGRSLLREALCAASGWDKETVEICQSQVGDTGETIGLLLQGKSEGEAMSLATADNLYEELFRANSNAFRIGILVNIFREYQPLSLKYFVKNITRDLRIGLSDKQIKEALAQAGRHAYLATIEVRLFRPADFMLAKVLDRIEDLDEPSDWVVEDKYDGMRAQVHFNSGQVRIYSRNQEDVTQSFPEIGAVCTALPGRGIIDGEILAWRDGRALNFNLLQRRIGKKRAGSALLTQVPTIFMAYDLLLRDGANLLEESLTIRRSKLAELPLALSPQYRTMSHAELDRLFAEARARGSEGLLLKRADSFYEPGKRSGAWLKLKHPYGTLDVVITAAEQGSGRRDTLFSEFTLGVRSADGFVNVGKVYSGVTNLDVRNLTKQLRSASQDKFGRMMLVKPAVVLEVTFDGVQRSTRHKSGYALRLPQIVRWRQDKRPEDCNTIEDVEALYRSSME